MTAPERFKAVEQLAMQGLLEWTVVDPGSVNFAHYDRLAAKQEGFVYLNPEGHVRYGLELAARYGFHPSYAIYEPGFLRLGAALARVYAAPGPVYRFMFSDGLAFGFAPKEYALEAYLKLLDDEAQGAPWMTRARRRHPPADPGRGRARRPRPGRARGRAAWHRAHQPAVGGAGGRGDRAGRRPCRERGRGAPATSAVSRLTSLSPAARRGWVAGPGKSARGRAHGATRERDDRSATRQPVAPFVQWDMSRGVVK